MQKKYNSFTMLLPLLLFFSIIVSISLQISVDEINVLLNDQSDDFGSYILLNQELRTIIWILILIFLLLASKNSFIQDDAFISFRYAYNLAHNRELTWNPGEKERVEGYSNFLWTIIIAVSISLGMNPVSVSKVLGLLCALGTFFFTYQLSLLVFQAPLFVLLIIVFLGTNYTFESYATGGLETQLQSFLIVTGTYMACNIVAYDRLLNSSPLIILSFLCITALLTRLDSILPFIILYIFIGFALYGHQAPVMKRVLAWTYLTFPVSIIMGLWLLWKFYYYGNILPNTYYVKASYFSLEVLKRGVFYICMFFYSYFFIPFLFLGIIYSQNLLSQPYLRIILTIVILWCIYILKIGGDFMEFRLFVPILPLFFVLILSLIQSLNETNLRIAFVFIVLLGALHHFVTFRYINGIESISQLNGHIVNKHENWEKVGMVLKEMFSESEDAVIIATTAAGAIPYYSQLPTIDMLGLNDKWIARNCPISNSRPGHQKRATLEYLLKRNVNLVVGHPQVEPISVISKQQYSIHDLKRFIRFKIRKFEECLIPKTSKVIEIPLDTEYKITVLYLVQHGYLDNVIENLGLRTYEIY